MSTSPQEPYHTEIKVYSDHKKYELKQQHIGTTFPLPSKDIQKITNISQVLIAPNAMQVNILIMANFLVVVFKIV